MPAHITDPQLSPATTKAELMARVLADHGLGHVRLALDPELPQLSAGGELRVVIPWSPP